MVKSRKNTISSKEGGVLRIIGGLHRGRKLSIPALEGLRPTSDRTRETLFNWLQFDLPGMAVLDLFAGTGALGLEALSRGAGSAVFVEPQMQAARGIQQSLTTLKLAQGAVHIQAASQFSHSNPGSFDLVFVDPPFSEGLWDSTLKDLVDENIVKESGFIYLECPKQQEVAIPASLTTVKDKTAGKVRFRLLQKAELTA